MIALVQRPHAPITTLSGKSWRFMAVIGRSSPPAVNNVIPVQIFSGAFRNVATWAALELVDWAIAGCGTTSASNSVATMMSFNVRPPYDWLLPGES